MPHYVEWSTSGVGHTIESFPYFFARDFVREFLRIEVLVSHQIAQTKQTPDEEAAGS